MDIKLILKDTMDGLDELSNPILQRKLWIGDDKESMSSFTEVICEIFDDSGLSRAIESNYVPEPFLSQFLKLGELVREIPEDDYPEEIMKHPKMNSVKIISLDILKLIHSENIVT